MVVFEHTRTPRRGGMITEIREGKVTTYGHIAKLIGKRAYRLE